MNWSKFGVRPSPRRFATPLSPLGRGAGGEGTLRFNQCNRTLILINRRKEHSITTRFISIFYRDHQTPAQRMPVGPRADARIDPQLYYRRSIRMRRSDR